MYLPDTKMKNTGRFMKLIILRINLRIIKQDVRTGTCSFRNMKIKPLWLEYSVYIGHHLVECARKASSAFQVNGHQVDVLARAPDLPLVMHMSSAALATNACKAFPSKVAPILFNGTEMKKVVVTGFFNFYFCDIVKVVSTTKRVNQTRQGAILIWSQTSTVWLA